VPPPECFPPGANTRDWVDQRPAAVAHVHLTADVLDRIDEIVTPGTLINPADSSYDNPALEPSARRRT
jgi:hypothetical protein